MTVLIRFYPNPLYHFFRSDIPELTYSHTKTIFSFLVSLVQYESSEGTLRFVIHLQSLP